MQDSQVVTPQDREEIRLRLHRLGFKNITWEGHTVRCIHPKRKQATITEAIRRMGFHVGSGGFATDAYATVFSREFQAAHEQAWERAWHRTSGVSS